MPIFGDRPRRQLPRRGGRRRTLGEERDQRPRALEYHALLIRQGAVIHQGGNSAAACHALPHVDEPGMLPQPPFRHASFSVAGETRGSAPMFSTRADRRGETAWCC
jgi:hypothetical protein